MDVNHVFKYTIHLKGDIRLPDERIYTNIDFSDRVEKQNPDIKDSWELMRKTEDEIESIYFTKEKIDQLKKELCKRIMEDPNPFNISCTDWDGGYEVDEIKLLENIIEIK
jgi:hypothetical protein